MVNKSILFIFLLLITFIVSFAQQPGDLDGDFDADGTVVTDITNVADGGNSVVVQPDGKIVVTGTSGFGLGEDFTTIRYQTDGSLDNSFGTNGIVTTDFSGASDRASSVALQPDGKILVGGFSNAVVSVNTFAIVRYNQDGTVDNSFSTFNGSGEFIGPQGFCFAIAIQPDGKIVAAGATETPSLQFLIARYNTDGTIDVSFGVNGVVTTDFGGSVSLAWAVTIQLDGKIIAVGVNDGDFGIARYTASGLLDNSFSVDGMVSTDFSTSDEAFSVLNQPDGKILVGGRSVIGSSEGYALVRYNSDGTLDNSFGTTGKVTTDVGGGVGGALVCQPDGKIILAGSPDFTVVRYHNDGSLDSTFASDGMTTFSPTEGGNNLADCTLQPNGKIVLAGGGRAGIDPANGGYVVARIISGLNLGVVSFSVQDNAMLFYPNPVQESAVLAYTLTEDETVSINLFDISGRLVQSFVRSEKRMKGDHKESLAIDASVPSGTYILTLSNGMGSSSVRVVKQSKIRIH